MQILNFKFFLLKKVGEGEGVSSDCDVFFILK